MTLTSEIDPVAVRHTLTRHREKGTDWPIAWGDATGHRRPSQDERSMYSFMESHFRAAYYNTPSSLGRCSVPERDVSMAPTMAQHPRDVPTRFDQCRSGDGCARTATHGRFRPTWCERHHAELSRLSRTLDLDVSFNPAKKRAA